MSFYAKSVNRNKSSKLPFR